MSGLKLMKSYVQKDRSDIEVTSVIPHKTNEGIGITDRVPDLKFIGSLKTVNMKLKLTSGSDLPLLRF